MTDTATGAEIRTGLYIDGAHQDAAESFAVHDPADPDRVVGYAAAATEDQARAAVTAAHDAFPAWAALGAHERAAQVRASLGALAADNDERVELLSRENGKVRSECEIEMHVLENRFELAAGLADVVAGVRELPAPPFRTEVSYLPLGVVTLIVPFNWPLAILAASLPQALVAGNTVIVKAPPTTPLSFVRTIELIAAELPPGVLNVVSGQDAVLGPVLIQDPRVRKVCFTGSVGGGKRIMAMASDNLTRVTLELGGNDPAIVLADAQVTEETIGKLYVGAFLTTGQMCMAMKRLYVHRSHYDAVVEGLSGAVGAQKIGHGLDPDATMGPLNSDRQREYVTELLEEAREQRRGARAGRVGRRRGVRAGPVHAPVARPRPVGRRAGRHRGAVRPDAARSSPSTTRPTRSPRPTTPGRGCARRCGRRTPSTPGASPPSCARAPRSSTRTTLRSSTSARRSAASTRAAWAGRWASRGSSSSPTPTPSLTRRKSATASAHSRGGRPRLFG